MTCDEKEVNNRRRQQRPNEKKNSIHPQTSYKRKKRNGALGDTKQEESTN